MSQPLKLYNLQPSPNNVKVRIALGYKQLVYEKIDIDPMDRSVVLEVSGQPLTPVLVHGDTVVFDSSAIMRYLDANFRDTPRLYPSQRDQLKAVERWEIWEKTKLAPPIGEVIFALFGGDAGEGAMLRANEAHNLACADLEGALSDKDFLVGTTLTAADIVAATGASYGLIREADDPIRAFVKEHLHMDPSFEKLAAWVDRVLAFDK